jgi:hypothetical protein
MRLADQIRLAERFDAEADVAHQLDREEPRMTRRRVWRGRDGPRRAQAEGWLAGGRAPSSGLKPERLADSIERA